MIKNKIFMVIPLLVLISCAANPHAASVKIYAQQKNYGKMLKEAKKWVKTEPDNPEAYLWLSRSYTLNKMYLEGVKALFVAFEKGYNKPLEDIDIVTFFNGAMKAKEKGDLELAIKAMLKVKELEPGNAKTYMNLAAFYTEKNEKEKAKKVLEEGCKKIPDDPELNYFYARFLIEENMDKAEEICSNMVKKNIPPVHISRFYGILGEIYIKKEKYEEAYKSFKKAYEDDTTQITHLFNMALSLFFMKEYEKSAKIFEKYISKNPEDAVALEYAGRSYHLIKDYKKALEKYDKAIEIKPTSMLYQLKADCLSKLGRMKEALETLKKAEKLKK